MIGSIAGDIIGSVYEFHNIKSLDFPLFNPKCTFTDDTVCTLGIASAVIFRKRQSNNIFTAIQKRNLYKEFLRNICLKYPNRGYGYNFEKWIKGEINKPYKSYGNGSAMRVSAVGFAFDRLDSVLTEAKLCSEITHNHRQGIIGAQAVATAIFFARAGESKSFIKNYIEKKFQYNLRFTLNQIRGSYGYDISCQGSVPQAIVAFLESENYEDAIRKAISIGGDSDTIACITGGIAQAFYRKIPEYIITKVKFYLDLRLKKILNEFKEIFKITY